MDIGTFSISLAIRDIAASKAFYQKLGFTAVGGNEAENWLIMRNGATTIGLFQGMFEHNILTFNPGWDANGQPLETFTDIRAIQQQLAESGVDTDGEIAPDSEGPASFIVQDPDGNTILFDQHR